MFQPEQAAVVRHLVDPDLLVVNLVASFVLEKIKQWKAIPWINQNTIKLNKGLAAAISLAAILGVHFVTKNPESGVYVITVTGLGVTSILHAGFDWLKSYIGQEIMYQKLIRPNGNDSLSGVRQ